MYTVTIRDQRGNVLAEGRGRTDWQTTAARLYRAWGKRPGRFVALAEDVGQPKRGRLWHVQFGRAVGDGSTSLDPMVVVLVTDE